MKIVKKMYREPKKLYLIICEDTKIAPSYFKHIKRLYKLKYLHIKEKLNNKSDPLNIYKFAKEQYKKLHNTKAQVFIVIDIDNHTNIEKIEQDIEKKPQYSLMKSDPCFEYWLLLHLKKTDKPFSNCSEVKKEVTKISHHKIIRNYVTKENITKAYKRAKRRDSSNPYSHIYKIIEQIIIEKESTM